MNTRILSASFFLSIFIIACNTSTNDKTGENNKRDSTMYDSAISRIMKNPAATNQMMIVMMEQCEKDTTLYSVINIKILANYSMMNTMMNNIIGQCDKDSIACSMMFGKIMNSPKLTDMIEGRKN